ncbi:GH1 family beta-glucosidase [uncultured Flavobacterium sp.]|uniref:GH1 family beta-glucosidase n=1 Tax=uncultured Flavobacterium sp. TaxID=165435 RepID=UPI0025EE8EE5|nr:GH1 family beta-glucosidase [uncultured Flavobacterium sp.]
MELKENILAKELFGEDFKWGVSTAAYQIEGSHDMHGKGLSVWDIFTARAGAVANGHHGNTACDFYNTYLQDIAIIKELGIPNFRFSLSWPRIIPAGTGEVNQNGIDFYNKVIDACLDNGIEPWVTLYHWDLPHELELLGGWTNREVISWFKEYTTVCAKAFGDRVKYWMVLNEPMVFTGAGYFLGVHAPGKKGLPNFLPAAHHAVLCMAEGARVLRDMVPDAQIGTTFSCSYIEPYTTNRKDVVAARRVDALMNRLFIEPVLGLGYPEEDLPVVKKMKKYYQPGDDRLMQFDFDFIGIQNYTREIIKHSIFVPYLNAALVKAENRKVPLTAMGWEVYPPSIYHMLKKYSEYPGVGKIYITENGAAFPDEAADGKVNDTERVQYLRNYLKQVLKARNEGVNVQGYFVWTLLDNFEWAEGYHPRFGLVHVDFETQQRIVKSSGHWYKAFLKG